MEATPFGTLQGDHTGLGRSELIRSGAAFTASGRVRRQWRMDTWAQARGSARHARESPLPSRIADRFTVCANARLRIMPTYFYAKCHVGIRDAFLGIVSLHSCRSATTNPFAATRARIRQAFPMRHMSSGSTTAVATRVFNQRGALGRSDSRPLVSRLLRSGKARADECTIGVKMLLGNDNAAEASMLVLPA